MERNKPKNTIAPLGVTANKKIHNVKIGYFLAYRQLKHASIWTTSLIVVVMMLTFLNLVVVNGILVGLIESSIQASEERYSGNVIISNLRQKTIIENSAEIEKVLENLPNVTDVVPRVLAGGTIKADYNRLLREEETPNQAQATISGIVPSQEDKATGLSKYVIDGAYLDDNDKDGILIGAYLVNEITPVDAIGFTQLREVAVGDRLKVTVGENSKEVFIRGFLKSKIDNIDARVIMTQSELRKLIGRSDTNVSEIAVKLVPGSTELDGVRVKEILSANGYDFDAKIQTATEAQPKFLKDMKSLFGLLGTLMGSIGLVVASITVFIVIFVNTLTRRKFIGILKGIGISSKSIEYSYIMQSAFYAIVGAALGMLVLYVFLVPFIDAHPINFPFSDGILYAPLGGTMWRVLALFVTTIIAGYIPARMIVKKNTLDSILGR
ncbi:ABC transporter permease [Candidatus Parcubacteria bacterium]|nr:ABC transporter permease [Candidatus Parcubacteria bacterium]